MNDSSSLYSNPFLNQLKIVPKKKVINSTFPFRNIVQSFFLPFIWRMEDERIFNVLAFFIFTKLFVDFVWFIM